MGGTCVCVIVGVGVNYCDPKNVPSVCDRRHADFDLEVFLRAPRFNWGGFL